jgi:hypothetical protein
MTSLPSLNLSYRKEIATTLDQTQTTTATNNNTVVFRMNDPIFPYQ